jgi:small-conductance mechanosensitive channel
MEQNGVIMTPEQQHNKSAVTAMVLGIVGLVITWFPIVGLVLSIVGFSVARSNRRYAAEHGLKENSMNEAGYVCGLIGLIAGILTILLTILVVVGVFAFAGTWIYQNIVLPEIM